MFARVNGITLYYERHGRGTPVVLVHGLGLTHDMWRHQVPALAEHFDVLAIDTRGHGQTDAPTEPYDMPMYVEDLRQLLDTLGVERPALVGLSMGGGIVQSFALAYPERVRALGLICTSSEFVPATRDRFYVWADAAERGELGPLVPGMVAGYFAPAFIASHPDEVRLVEQTEAGTSPHGFANAARANAARNWSDRLGGITCPVLFVGGELDPADPVRNSAIFRRHLRDLEVHILPGVSHLLPLEMPERFNEILLGFLKRVESRG